MIADRGSFAAGQVYLLQRPEPARKPVSLPSRLDVLAGRDELLAEVHALLTAEDRPGPRLVVLCGLGGVGKTSVAGEYAHRHLTEVGVAWQLAAEEADVLEVQMAELAAQLGGRHSADPRDAVASVHALLAAWPDDWLLIFDNAPDEASLRRFLPPAGRGRVLITSQSQHWPGRAIVDVPVLTPEVAARFLLRRTDDTDWQTAAALAAELGGLPLALDQAAAYMQATGTALAQYLPLLRRRQADLLSRGDVPGHRVDVAATLGLALSRLADQAPSARGLIRVLAFLAPEAAPLTLLLVTDRRPNDVWLLGPEVAAEVGALLGDPVALGDAIAALRRYSLVTLAGNGLVLVHRLVQDITRAQLTADEAALWRRAVGALVEVAVPEETWLPERWPTYAALLPHARVLLYMTGQQMWWISHYLLSSGNYHAAVDLLQQIVGAYEESSHYGPDHPETLVVRAELAGAVGLAGNAAQARDQYAALLPCFDEVLGAYHSETLKIRHNLAHWTGQAGDAAGALDQFAALLPLREKLDGPEDPETLNTRANLAGWIAAVGDAATARDQYAALLPVYERVFGPEDSRTLEARYRVAVSTGDAGDPALARDLLTALVLTYERVMGPEHAVTLRVRHDLATWTMEAGDAAEAGDQLAALLLAEQRIIGPEHPDTLATRYALARWTAAARSTAEARDQLTALLAVYERVFGPEHPVTLEARDKLAAWTTQARDGSAG